MVRINRGQGAGRPRTVQEADGLNAETESQYNHTEEGLGSGVAGLGGYQYGSVSMTAESAPLPIVVQKARPTGPSRLVKGIIGAGGVLFILALGGAMSRASSPSTASPATAKWQPQSLNDLDIGAMPLEESAKATSPPTEAMTAPPTEAMEPKKAKKVKTAAGPPDDAVVPIDIVDAEGPPDDAVVPTPPPAVDVDGPPDDAVVPIDIVDAEGPPDDAVVSTPSKSKKHFLSPPEPAAGPPNDANVNAEGPPNDAVVPPPKEKKHKYHAPESAAGPPNDANVNAVGPPNDARVTAAPTKLKDEDRVMFCMQQNCNHYMAALGMDYTNADSRKLSSCIEDALANKEKAMLCFDGPDVKLSKAGEETKMCAGCKECLPYVISDKVCAKLTYTWGAAPAGGYGGGGGGGAGWGGFGGPVPSPADVLTTTATAAPSSTSSTTSSTDTTDAATPAPAPARPKGCWSIWWCPGGGANTPSPAPAPKPILKPGSTAPAPLAKPKCWNPFYCPGSK